MAVNTFGVTVATLSSEVQGLTFTASSTPTTAEAARVILRAASRVERECMAVGIDTQALTDTSDSRYMLIEWAVTACALSMILAGRDRGNPEAGKYYETQYRETIRDVRVRPQAIDDKDTGPDLLAFPGQNEWSGTTSGAGCGVPSGCASDWSNSLSRKIVCGGL